MKKRALISVSNKNNLIDFAKFLESKNYELISTGGTFRHLKEAGLNPIQIDEVTNFPDSSDSAFSDFTALQNAKMRTRIAPHLPTVQNRRQPSF